MDKAATLNLTAYFSSCPDALFPMHALLFLPYKGNTLVVRKKEKLQATKSLRASYDLVDAVQWMVEKEVLFL